MRFHRGQVDAFEHQSNFSFIQVSINCRVSGKSWILQDSPGTSQSVLENPEDFCVYLSTCCNCTTFKDPTIEFTTALMMTFISTVLHLDHVNSPHLQMLSHKVLHPGSGSVCGASGVLKEVEQEMTKVEMLPH